MKKFYRLAAMLLCICMLFGESTSIFALEEGGNIATAVNTEATISTAIHTEDTTFTETNTETMVSIVAMDEGVVSTAVNVDMVDLNFNMTDLRSSTQKTLNTNDGKFAIYVFGGIGTCYYTKAALTDMCELFEYVNPNDITVWAFDIRSDNPASNVKAWLEEAGISTNICANEVDCSDSAYSLYRFCYSNFIGSGNSFTMPLIVYKNPSGNAFAYTTARTGLSEMLDILEAGGMSVNRPASNVNLYNVTGDFSYTYAYEILNILNTERAAAGLSALTMDKDLLDAAMTRAAECGVYYDHTRPNGEICFSLSDKMHGENIAVGYQSPASVMNAWMNSEGHRNNILNSSFQSVGIGVFKFQNRYYWVQCFGRGVAETGAQPADKTAMKQVYSVMNAPFVDMTSLTLEVGASEWIPVFIDNTFVYVTVQDSFNWSSSNPAVAQVSAYGQVTAMSGGTATITATNINCPSSVVSCNVTVNDPAQGGGTGDGAGGTGDIVGGVTEEQKAQIRAFVERMYTIVLNRAADENGLDDWTTGLIEQRVDGAEVVNGFVNSAEFRARNLSDEDYIKTLYLAILNREADAAGLADWLRAFALGQTRQDLLDGFVTSAEFDALCDSYGILAVMTQEDMVRSFASRMYTVALNRPADEAGLIYWVSKLMSGSADGAAIADGFINSPEFIARNLNNVDYIRTLYRTFLNREADTDGLNNWLNAFTQGYSRPEILNAFIATEEFGALCDSYGISAILTQRDRVSNFVARMYTVALNRDYDEAGLNDWVTGLMNGVIKGAEVAEGFIMSAEFESRGLSDPDYVRILYRTFFNREGSDHDILGWVSAMDVYGQSRRDVLKGFVNSGEFEALCNEYGIVRGSL